MKQRQWVIGSSSEHVESATIYLVHLEKPKFVAVYCIAPQPEIRTLQFDKQQVFSLESDPLFLPHPEEIDARCIEAVTTLKDPRELLPGINQQNFDGNLPEWIIGDNPADSGDESAPTLVVHTTYPRFVVPIYEGIDTFSAQPKLMEFWDDVSSAGGIKAWAKKAMKARDRFYDRWEYWDSINKKVAPTFSHSIQ